MSAAALFTDLLGRILLVKPTYREQWLLPGGGAEPGESPAQAWVREVREELGVERTPGRLLAVHWVPPDHPDIDARMTVPGEVRYVLDGGALTQEETAALHVPADELLGFEFVDSTQTTAATGTMILVHGILSAAASRIRAGTSTANGHTHTRPGDEWFSEVHCDRSDLAPEFWEAGLPWFARDDGIAVRPATDPVSSLVAAGSHAPEAPLGSAAHEGARP
ncbi:NUDIX domain-containing protein [Streptomyces sp. NPDC055036]